ncbi:MAG: AAA family ATPase [Rhodospirillaceae bacterium]|nr:AAA family ATPase [Rhodospirillaceae bacterium]
MLTLRRLEIEGFGPFADRAVLTFPEQQGVTVVYADNMRGKTSLMNAIRYAFFGEIQGRGEHSLSYISACNRDLVATGKYGFTIGLSLRHQGIDFDLMREVIPKVDVPQGDQDFTPTVSLRRGGVVLGPADRETRLRAMLPKDVARFFLFDGELLDQYAELLISESEAGRVISEAIEQILGVPVLRNARDHLSALASAISRASAKEASKYRKTQAIGIALQTANDTKEAHEHERDRKATELQELQAQREEIETELRHQGTLAAAVERLDRARTELEVARNTQDVKATELKIAMKDAWRTVLEEPVADAKVAAQQAFNEAFAQLVTSLRVDAIENGHCCICDQQVPENVGARLTASLPTDTPAADIA